MSAATRPFLAPFVAALALSMLGPTDVQAHAGPKGHKHKRAANGESLLSDLMAKDLAGLQKILTPQGETGVATVMPVHPSVIATVRAHLQIYNSVTKGKAYAVLVPKTGSVEPYTGLRDAMKLGGEDLLVITTGTVWSIHCAAVPSEKLAKLKAEVVAMKGSQPEKLARLVAALQEALGPAAEPAAPDQPAVQPAEPSPPAEPPAAEPPPAPVTPPAAPSAPAAQPAPAQPIPAQAAATEPTAAASDSGSNGTTMFLLGLLVGALLGGGAMWFIGRRPSA